MRDGKSTAENSEADAGPAVPVLRDINLDVAAGQVIALVGPSGAGKTTLCNLVARFFDPTSGSIALDGRDIREITIDSYRRLFGIVEQDTFLFDGTLAENIAYGRRNATQAEIEQAASAANAAEFIENLSAGYETWIGERGVKLSAGQRQRITIARALLADPRILIFDEATSNLDTESERLIQASLQTLMQGRTSFVIAHRLSTIAHADRILVMEKGRIVEQGRHEELMQANSRYREMVLLQTSPPAPPRRRALDEDARCSRVRYSTATCSNRFTGIAGPTSPAYFPRLPLTPTSPKTTSSCPSAWAVLSKPVAKDDGDVSGHATERRSALLQPGVQAGHRLLRAEHFLNQRGVPGTAPGEDDARPTNAPAAAGACRAGARDGAHIQNAPRHRRKHTVPRRRLQRRWRQSHA